MRKLFKPEEGTAPWFFLLVMGMTTAWTINGAAWTSGLRILASVAPISLAAGFLLARSVFRPRTCHFLNTVYGLAWIGFLIGREFMEGLTLRERILEQVYRVLYWVGKLFSGGTSSDDMIFVFLLAGLLWAVCYNAVWSTYRQHSPWRAIVPLGVVILVNLYYYAGPSALSLYAVAFIIFAMLYLARVRFYQNEYIWRRERVGCDAAGAQFSGLTFDVGRAALVLVLVALLSAWLVPDLAASNQFQKVWEGVSGPWRTVQDEFHRLFASLRGDQQRVWGEPFGPSLGLGGERHLGDAVVIEVAAPNDERERYYWRGGVYSTYDGSSWETSEVDRLVIVPKRSPAGLPRDLLRHPVTQTVTSHLTGRTLLMAAPDPVWFDRGAEARLHASEEGPLELLRVFSDEPLARGDSYTVISLRSHADVTSLRAAGDEYPDWVLEHYLQLPPSLPQRVRDLAAEISAEAETPYDKAIAIQQYLRAHMHYDLLAPDLAAGQDFVDQFLFETQTGYCDHFATAMVVLARSVDVPARMAGGYTQGEYLPADRIYRVRGYNAHSWPEVYFPSYGWMQFEPTTSEAPISRPLTQPSEEENAGVTGGEEETGIDDEMLGPDRPYLPDGGEWEDDFQPGAAPTSQRGLPWWAWMGSVLGLVGAPFLALWVIENVGLGRLLPVERAYARLLRWGQWTGQPLHHHHTPYEWAEALTAKIPAAHEAVRKIVDLYVLGRFANGDMSDPTALTTWSEARRTLWEGSARQWLSRLQAPGARDRARGV